MSGPVGGEHRSGERGKRRYCGWTTSISHPFETKGNHCLLAFTGESSFKGFFGGAGLRPSTVGVLFIGEFA